MQRPIRWPWLHLSRVQEAARETDCIAKESADGKTGRGQKRMIVKTSSGYMVVSENGKALSAKNLTKAEAKKRLAQVELFKYLKGSKKS